MVKIRGLFLQV